MDLEVWVRIWKCESNLGGEMRLEYELGGCEAAWGSRYRCEAVSDCALR